MNAPDKIYAGFYPVDNELRQEWSSAPMYGVETTEYIRKDALLGWAKKEYLSLRNGTKADQIKSSAFFEVVKHIESL